MSVWEWASTLRRCRD